MVLETFPDYRRFYFLMKSMVQIMITVVAVAAAALLFQRSDSLSKELADANAERASLLAEVESLKKDLKKQGSGLPGQGELKRMEGAEGDLLKLRSELPKLKTELEKKDGELARTKSRVDKLEGKMKTLLAELKNKSMQSELEDLASRSDIEVSAMVGRGNSLIAGGYVMKNGQRAIILATPEQQANGQIVMGFKLVGADDQGLKAAGLDAFVVNDAQGFPSTQLDRAQMNSLIQTLSSIDGADVMSSPRLTTMPGLQATVFVGQGDGALSINSVAQPSENGDQMQMDLKVDFGVIPEKPTGDMIQEAPARRLQAPPVPQLPPGFPKDAFEKK